MNNSKKNKNKLKTPKEVEAPKSKADESKVEKESSKDTESLLDKNNFQNYLIGFILIAILIGIFVFAYTTSNDNSDPSILTPNNNISLEDGMRAAKLASQEMMAEIKAEMPVLPPMDGPSSSIPDAGQETSAEDSKAVKSNFLNSPTTLLIILSLLTLISISLSFWLYYWRKLSIAGKEIMVPEKFEKSIKSLNKSSKESTSIIQNALDNQTAALKSSRTISDNTNDEIARISEIITHLHSALEKKDEEMERFKKGYDADIYKQFLLRFTKVDRVLKEYIDDGEIDLDGLGDIQEEMEEALLECRVESFSPEVGVDYKAQDNIADNPKKIPTTDKSQHETVAEVLQMGYVRKCEDSSIEVISKAKVKVYDFAESEKNDESNAVNNDESNAVNNDESNAVNNDESNAVNNDESNAVNNDESNAVNNDESNAVNNDESNAVNNDESNAVNNDESNAVNNDESNAVNNDESNAVNNDESNAVNNDESNAVNNDESNAVNNDESNAVNDSDILSLLEIDPTLSNNEILGQLDKEFSKLNNRLHSLIDGEEKNNANQRIELINQAKKIYESK
ncbi:hypothetical protein ABXT44_04345 [Candidatus Pseudothioglobus sp. Uisw_041]|uniref:bacteriophage T4 gp5 trimerisation domain-containing protein n=1 Tax=Candidatus Pseudothioglobus sp. Uisw_041 TaxID=3230996 RepID=UPI003A8408B4